ncbi:MAG: ABC transporter permease [Bacteroidetes bacterium]|nr:ABC transporter permease [Bacteroidota bacterium]
MNSKDLLKISFSSLLRNGIRSWLTVLGVVIGVASVIAMQAIGNGSDESIKREIRSLGVNVLMIFPGTFRMGGVAQSAGSMSVLETGDAVAIKKTMKTVNAVTPLVQSGQQVVYQTQNWRTNVTGVWADYFIIKNYKTTQGRLLTEQEASGMSKNCLIGKTVYSKLFPNGGNPVGVTIRVGSVPMKIVGVLEAKGSGTFGQDQDDVILAPFKTVQKRLMAVDFIQQIQVSARSEHEMTSAQAELRAYFLKKPNMISADGEERFSIRSQSEISSVLGSVSSVLILLLSSIAAISLVVGGIGIMNIMLVSVTERTREIGLRMALGATDRDVRTQFLAESVMLSVWGGILGILFGYLISVTVGSILNWPVSVSPFSIGLAFTFSALVGIFFGYYPAKKASQLDPIEALRYE